VISSFFFILILKVAYLNSLYIICSDYFTCLEIRNLENKKVRFSFLKTVFSTKGWILSINGKM